jgi:hypothetical protein
VSTPILSVILATDSYDTIRGVISALNRQRSPGLIEVVIAVPHGEQQGARRDELSRFGQTMIVGVDGVVPLAPARAAAVRAASAPFVFIGETHTYPQPGFAEAIVAAFDRPCAAVVPAVLNANPLSVWSWIAYTFDYASWGPHRQSGWIPDPLTHNTAYRRELLMELGDHLTAALDTFEEGMWPVLHARGHRAWFAGDARLAHLNVGTPAALFTERFAVGATLGKKRSSRWTWLRRAVYTAMSPLVALVLVARVLRRGTGAVPPSRLPAVLVGIVFSAITKVVGEVAGYMGFELEAVEELETEYEIHKMRYAGPVHD